MGFHFRRSVGVGPFRLNLSKSGVGWSVGGRGFRTGVSSRGRRYTTFGLPGTGLGYRSYGRRARGCALPFMIGVAIPLLVAGGAALAAAHGVLASLLAEGT
jgi:hypothetical protein